VGKPHHFFPNRALAFANPALRDQSNKIKSITFRREPVAADGQLRVIGPPCFVDGLLPRQVFVVAFPAVWHQRVAAGAGNKVSPRVARRPTCTQFFSNKDFIHLFVYFPYIYIKLIYKVP